MLVKSIYTTIFESNKKYYLYNSRSNYFVEISQPFYNILCNESWSDLPDSILQNLISHEAVMETANLYNFYFSELFKFNSRNYNNSVLNLIIAPTTACNFACPYCFEPKKETKTISTETIDELIKFIKAHENAKSILLTWYGGEPLVAFDKIKLIYDKLLKDDMPTLSFQSIVTNGYLFSEEVVDFFGKVGLNSIQITIDGVEEKHNATRCLKGSAKPTFGKIISNIDFILTHLTNVRLDIRVNINKENYLNYVEVKRFFDNKYPENSHVRVYPGIIREDNDEKVSLCDSSFKTTELMELHNLIRKEGIDTSDFPRREDRGCMMQMAYGYLIGPEGEIYKCWNDVGQEGTVIGNISDQKLSNPFRFVKYTMQSSPFNDECKKCSVFPICSGGCSHHRFRNEFEGGHFDVCCPYKDIENLKKALLSGIKPAL